MNYTTINAFNTIDRLSTLTDGFLPSISADELTGILKEFGDANINLDVKSPFISEADVCLSFTDHFGNENTMTGKLTLELYLTTRLPFWNINFEPVK